MSQKDFPLPEVALKPMVITKGKRDSRSAFKSAKRSWLHSLISNPATKKQLEQVFDSRQMAVLANGRSPEGWNVHHKLPLSHGGLNKPENFLLIRYGSGAEQPHELMHVALDAQGLQVMANGEQRRVYVPDYEGPVYPHKPDRQFVEDIKKAGKRKYEFMSEYLPSDAPKREAASQGKDREQSQDKERDQDSHRSFPENQHSHRKGKKKHRKHHHDR